MGVVAGTGTCSAAEHMRFGERIRRSGLIHNGFLPRPENTDRVAEVVARLIKCTKACQ